MKLLDEAMALARSKESKKEAQTTDQGNPDRVFLISTYHPVDVTLKDIVLKNWEVLGKSPTTSTFHERKLMLGYRRPTNLKGVVQG